MSSSNHPIFSCDAGPHVLLPNALLSNWKGVGEDYSPEDTTSDYARACSIERAVGLLPVATGTALIIAGSPRLSSWHWVPKGVQVVVLLHWESADLQQVLNVITEKSSQVPMHREGMFWEVPDGGVLLFFAGDSGIHPTYGSLSIPIPAGRYSISQGRYAGEIGSALLVNIEAQK